MGMLAVGGRSDCCYDITYVALGYLDYREDGVHFFLRLGHLVGSHVERLCNAWQPIVEQLDISAANIYLCILQDDNNIIALRPPATMEYLLIAATPAKSSDLAASKGISLTGCFGSCFRHTERTQFTMEHCSYSWWRYLPN